MPSDHPDKDMTLLHSLYGWGVVMVVAVSSCFFKVFGTRNWTYLTLFWAALPITASVFFCLSPIPELKLNTAETDSRKADRSKGIFLCAVCIFLGSSSENTMTSWISSYMEKALLIPKAVGDILGMAVFALLLTFTRVLYAKFGKNILKMLIFGMGGAIVCYIAAGSVNHVLIGFIACICTGICTAMLWPGTLILMEEIVPAPGVAAYALMAACGDFGAALAPQLTGILVDKFSAAGFVASYGAQHGQTADQFGLRLGVLCAAVFPILGFLWTLLIRRKTAEKQ